MYDGFKAILMYIAEHFYSVLYSYVWAFWFNQETPKGFTVFDREIKTNSHLERFHATFLKLINLIQKFGNS